MKIKPYRQGREAFAAGTPKDACPLTSEFDRQRWIWGWEEAELNQICSNSPIPDQSLIMEAEILLPKVSFGQNHELNACLGYYRDACKTGDVEKIKLNEAWLRRRIVKAKLSLLDQS